jgi:predicted PurR-regulated permease PerM
MSRAGRIAASTPAGTHRAAVRGATDDARMRLPRLLRSRRTAAEPPDAAAAAVEPQVVQLDATQLSELSAVFSAPRWLRDLGFAAWLLLGVAALLLAMVWLLGLTATIVGPVTVAFIVATVASPGVAWLERRRVPRAAGAALVLVTVVAIALLVVLLVIGGITSQQDQISAESTAAAQRAQGWLTDLGLNQSGATSTTEDVSSAVPDVMGTLAGGVIDVVSGLASMAFALSFAVFSLFFLLKDGPKMRAAVERQMGVPRPVARTVTGGVVLSLRRYFGGVTIVAAFNGAVVGAGAVLLGVPLAGTIAVVTFVTAYVPFIGAFVAGAFAVVLALGANGTQTAVIMLVIVLLANGLLQNIVQPIAFGATLRLNPLVVLVVTIGAGCLFGMIGLILAAPLTSAALHIQTQLARARAAPPETEAVAETA